MTCDGAALPVPVVHISLACAAHADADADADQSESTRRDLADACRTSGVFYARNHGIPEARLTHVSGPFDAFSDLSADERCAIEVSAGEWIASLPT